MAEWALILTAIATMIAAVGALITSVVAAVVMLRRLAEVKHEVKTVNGLTMAALSDRAEGRRIRDDIDADDRTEDEADYVRRLDDPDT